MKNQMNTEKVTETIVIEGVNFEIVEKPRTLYAGFHTVAPNAKDMPNPGETYNRYNEGKQNIVDAISPDCLSLYWLFESNLGRQTSLGVYAWTRNIQSRTT